MLSGCFGPRKIDIVAKPVEKPTLILPDADAMYLRPVHWTLITPGNFEEEIKNLKTKGRPIVFFSLTDKGYENLAMNTSDIRAYIQQQQAIIAAYENYYVKTEHALNSANEQLAEIDKKIKEVNSEELPWYKRLFTKSPNE